MYFSSYLMYMVYAHGTWTWYMYLLHGTCSWYMVHVHGNCIWYMYMVYAYGICRVYVYALCIWHMYMYMVNVHDHVHAYRFQLASGQLGLRCFSWFLNRIFGRNFVDVSTSVLAQKHLFHIQSLVLTTGADSPRKSVVDPQKSLNSEISGLSYEHSKYLK